MATNESGVAVMSEWCPACGGGAVLCSDLRVSGSHNLWRCGGCGMAFLEVEPDEEDAPFDEYWDDVNEQIYGDRKVVGELRRKFGRYLPDVRQRAPNNRILDLGSGAGIFLDAAHACGFESLGVEPSSRAVSICHQRYPDVHVVQGLLTGDDDLPRDLGCVTLWDVIEHVPEPGNLLSACTAHLAEGGLLLLETPDEGAVLRLLIRSAASISSRLDQRRKIYYRAHRYYFTRRAMEILLRNSGFRVVRFFRDHTMFEKSILKLRYYQGLGGLQEGVLRLVYDVLAVTPGMGNKMVVLARKL